MTVGGPQVFPPSLLICRILVGLAQSSQPGTPKYWAYSTYTCPKSSAAMAGSHWSPLVKPNRTCGLKPPPGGASAARLVPCDGALRATAGRTCPDLRPLPASGGEPARPSSTINSTASASSSITDRIRLPRLLEPSA